VVLHIREGQNQLFVSHFLHLHCGKDREGGAWRWLLRRRVRGFPCALVMEGRLLAMEREGQGHPLPCPLFSLSPTPLETLAAAMALHIGVTATARAADEMGAEASDGGATTVASSSTRALPGAWLRRPGSWRQGADFSSAPSTAGSAFSSAPTPTPTLSAPFSMIGRSFSPGRLDSPSRV
jgi:hypothetical protein